MLEKTFKITNDTGIDAKMSSLLVKKSGSFNSNITINVDENYVNLKSILGVMSLNVNKNQIIKISCNGADEIEAIKELALLISELKLGKEY